MEFRSALGNNAVLDRLWIVCELPVPHTPQKGVTRPVVPAVRLAYLNQWHASFDQAELAF